MFVFFLFFDIFNFSHGVVFSKARIILCFRATATTILNNTNVTSESQCVLSCYHENPGCLAINVITTGDVINCQMTAGLRNEKDMVDDSTSVLYVRSK